MIKRFKHVDGQYIEKIEGQERFAYSHTGISDFYELMESAEENVYEGSVIKFYNLQNGEIYYPFEKKKNVIYGKPVYSNGLYFFLRADYSDNVAELYCYYPEQLLELVKKFDFKDINLYNFSLIGHKVHVVSQDNIFNCYYPEQFSFNLDENETVILIENGIVYCQKWIEEDSNHKYYEKLVLRDFDGTVVSEETGSLFQNNDGIWWIA